MRTRVFISAVVLMYCCWQCSGKVLEGELVTPEKWAFVARFCFLSDDGQFEYHIEYDKLFGVQNLLLYFDEQHQWPSVYKTNKTCKQKEAVLNRDMGQIVSLNYQQVLNSGCYEIANRTVITCHNSRRFRSARERWWFLAISNCNSTQGLYMRYKFIMTNGAPEDFWHQQFSADEFFILPVLIGYFATYSLLLIAVFMCTAELKARQLLHATYKIFNASVTVQQFGIILQGIAYIRYANNGVGYPRLRNLGRLLESTSEVLYLLLMLLLAKGYTVTRGRLRVGSSVKLTVFMFMYIVTYTSLFLYESQSFDPGEVLYLYESPAGYGLILLRIIAWWMFIYSTVFTLKHYPEKANFYYPFNLIGTLWFVAGPAFILTANNLIDKWVRESIVCSAQHFIALVGHILFLILTLPNKANKNFPYHVRTTQIGVMELTDGRTGNNTLDYFGHHPYAPGGPPFPGPPFHYATSTRTSTPLNVGPVYRVASSHPLREWMVEVPVELFTVSRAVAIERLDMQTLQEVDLPGSSKGSRPSSSGISSQPNTELQQYQEISHATSTEPEQQSPHQQPATFPLPIATTATIYSPA